MTQMEIMSLNTQIILYEDLSTCNRMYLITEKQVMHKISDILCSVKVSDATKGLPDNQVEYILTHDQITKMRNMLIGLLDTKSEDGWLQRYNATIVDRTNLIGQLQRGT